MYLRDSRVLDYLLTRPDWDGKTIVLTGGSMGGQQSLALAGLPAGERSAPCSVCVPAGADSNGNLHGRKAGYRTGSPANADVMRTALLLRHGELRAAHQGAGHGGNRVHRYHLTAAASGRCSIRLRRRWKPLR
jgi:hypothetical protein